MPEVTQYVFSHKEVVEALIKKQGLHDGLWMLYVEFGLVAANVGPTEDQLTPAAVIPLAKLGLQKGQKENALTVDAAKVNPATT